MDLDLDLEHGWRIGNASKQLSPFEEALLGAIEAALQDVEAKMEAIAGTGKEIPRTDGHRRAKDPQTQATFQPAKWSWE